MTEPEHFEDDLFADLYVYCFPISSIPIGRWSATISAYTVTLMRLADQTNSYTEDDNINKTAAVATSETKAEPGPTIEPKVEVTTDHDDQNGNGDVDEQMYTGDQDEDDEIDFNTGNGDHHNSPPTLDAHGPGIKEDG